MEDIDTTGEDHVYDEACHVCMARPLAPAQAATPGEAGRIIDRLLAPAPDAADLFPQDDTEQP